MKFRNPTLEWIVAREYGSKANHCYIENQIGRPIYKQEDAWVGIHLFSKERLRRRDVSLLFDNN